MNDQSIGAQMGYSYGKASKLEAGVNYYFAWATPSEKYTHTFGPYCSLTGIFAGKNSYFGQQAGLNYHFTVLNWITAFRISPAFENNFHHDMRVGGDFGVSLLGVFVYGGYYAPVGSFESPYISRWRIGIRLVLNAAPVNIIGWN